MAVEYRVRLAKVLKILDRARMHIARLANHGSKICEGRVDNWHRMAFGEHKPVRSVEAWILGHPTHAVIHQAGDDVAEAECRGWMAAAGMSTGCQGE